MRKYLVVDIMTTTPVSIQEINTVKDAAKLMALKEVGSLIVLKKDDFAGIVTEQDLVIKVVSKGLDPAKVKIKEIMTPENNIISIEPGRSVYTAMNLMNQNDVRRLPVIENDKLQGIITMKDIFGIEPDLLENLFEVMPLEEREL